MNAEAIPWRCFQGVIPAAIATCDAAGLPNVTYLSQVYFLDARHVALSCQFFNKTKQNVLATGRASVELIDPETLETWHLQLRYLRAETSGPLFDRLSRRIDAIASHTGMSGIFKLVSADVYEVLEVEAVQDFLRPAGPPGPREAAALPPAPARTELACLQLVCQRASRATDLESLLHGVLEGLEEAFGFEHSMVLLCDEAAPRLYAVASRGYGESGAGAEVAVGEGLIGTVARERCVLRVAGVGAELRYGRAIRASVHRAGQGRALQHEIPLPGLLDAQSQLALPLLAGDRLIGVLAVESPSPGAFEDWHETSFEIIASQVALAIEGIVRRGLQEEAGEGARLPPPPSHQGEAPARTRTFVFYPGDDCVFVDDEYLVRNLPGKILWKLLSINQATGRTEFSNRELRLDGSLGLPAVRDNLESRLVLLRKRLEQKCPDLGLVSTGRGKFRLELRCAVVQRERDGASAP
jgi:hypothetical protein